MNREHIRPAPCCLGDPGEYNAAPLPETPLSTQTLQKAPETTSLVPGGGGFGGRQLPNEIQRGPASPAVGKEEHSLVYTVPSKPTTERRLPPGKEVAPLHTTDQRPFQPGRGALEPCRAQSCSVPGAQAAGLLQPPGQFHWAAHGSRKKAVVARSSLYILKNEVKSHHGCQAAQGARIFIFVLVVLPGMFTRPLAPPEMSLPQGDLA